MTSKVIYCPILHLSVRLTTPSIDCKTSDKSEKSGAAKKLMTDPPIDKPLKYPLPHIFLYRLL